MRFHKKAFSFLFPSQREAYPIVLISRTGFLMYLHFVAWTVAGESVTAREKGQPGCPGNHCRLQGNSNFYSYTVRS